MLGRYVQGYVLGALYCRYMFPASTPGEIPAVSCMIPALCVHNGMIIVPVGHGRALHIHHWMVYAAVLLVAARAGFGRCIGFAFVLVVHGHSYGDAFSVWVPSPYV